ncbi:MAG: cysteine desulfurase family protein [Fervidicoccaceae archaeon]
MASEKVRALLEAHGRPEREVYFDLENSGWVPREVIDAMLPYFNERGYGHPSITHRPGWEAQELLLSTKELIAETIGAESYEAINFTHSGTEANNLAVLGYLLANRKRGGRVLVSAVEHLSVVFPAELASELLGTKVVRVPVDGEGFVDPEILKYYVSRDVALVSVQLVNHEIGTIQRIKELVDVVKSANPDAVFHTDAADAYGRLSIDVEKLGVDMLTLSSHKIHGPRGVGVLYARPGVSLESPLRGQLSGEKLWPGVENVPLVAGFKRAIELAFRDLDGNASKMRTLRDKMLRGILETIDETLVNGPLGEKRAPDNVNVSFLRVEGEALTVELSLNGVYVSSGSACTSRILEPSHVLLAIGRRHEEAHGSLLMKVSRYHEDEDVDYALDVLRRAVARLRSISPA